MTALALVDVHVADVENGCIRPHQTIVIRNGRIARIGPSAEIESPKDAAKPPVSGKTVIPGLMDLHVHIAPHAAGRDYDEPEALRRAREFLLVFLASGVTTVRNMAGTPLHLALRDEVERGDTVGPRILTCGPILETRFTFPEIAEFGTLVTTPDEARKAVRDQKRQGYDFIKVYNDIDAPIYDAIVETARSLGMMIVGHVPFQKGLEGALAAGQNSIEHLRSYDFAADTRKGGGSTRFEGWLHTSQQRIDELAEKTAAAGVWNAPTMVVEHSLRSTEEMKLPREQLPAMLPPWLASEIEGTDLEGIFSPEQRDMLAQGRGARAAMVAALDKVGAGLLAGSDCPGCRLVPGRSLLRELELLVEAGLSPWRALRTATANAARFLGEPGEGLVATGNRADLVVLDEDPFADISAVREQAGVVVNGHWITTREITRQLLAA